MKRIVSILLVAVLLLAAAPTFAETGELQAGLYVSENGIDVLYLDTAGGGVFDYLDTAENLYSANGVAWSGSSLEIERTKTPFALRGEELIFTYGDAVRILRYAGAGEAYALGDREGTAFAGSYTAEDGKKLFLEADGKGVYTDASGEKAVLWGSLLPYWPNGTNVTENTCYVLFDSYLSGLTFQDGGVTVNTENEGDILFQPVAQEIYYGYKMTDEGQTYELIAIGVDPMSFRLIMRVDGTGRMTILGDSAEFTWTESAITAEGESVPYTREGDHILIIVDDESIEFAPAAEIEILLAEAAAEEIQTETEEPKKEEPTAEEPAAEEPAAEEPAAEEPAVEEPGVDDPLAEAPVVVPTAADLVGTWTFTKARTNGIEIPASLVGSTIVITLNEDGTATLSANGSSAQVDWAITEEGKVSLTVGGEEVYQPLIFDGTVLSLPAGNEGVELIFEKDI